MPWPHPDFGEPADHKASEVHALHPSLTSPQSAPRETHQEVGKDRKNAEFKASAAGPHTAPAEHLEQTQCLVGHVKMVSTPLSAAAQKLEKIIHWI